MALFVEIARTASFSRASERLGIPNATVSRRIAAMERRLGVRLFERTTRNVILTSAARRYYERCAPLVDAALIADEELRATAHEIRGELRISMPVDLGINYLAPMLPQFVARYPQITLRLDLSPKFTNLTAEACDLALRLAPVHDEHLISRRIGVIYQGLYASPGYLDLHGRPRTPHDLTGHECLHVPVLNGTALWTFTDGERNERIAVAVRGQIGANSMRMLATLAEQGLGIALLPIEIVKEAVARQRLEPILSHYALPGWELFAVTASRPQSAALRAFLEFLAGHWSRMEDGDPRP